MLTAFAPESYADVDGSPWESGYPGTTPPEPEEDGCPAKGLLDRVVNCIDVPLEAATGEMLAVVYAVMQPAIAAFMVLTVVIYGLKMASGGVRDVKGETIVLLIKIAGVAYFTQNFSDWYPGIIAAVDDSVRIVVQPLTKSILVCPGIPEDNLWARMDCMLFALLGIAGVGTVISPFIGNMIGTATTDIPFLGSGLGTMVAAMGMGFVLAMFFGFVKIMLGFIAAKIAIAFLIALAPMFVPLLLMSVTKNYFMKWANHLASYCIQPFLLFAFVALAMTAMDKAVFTGQYSLATGLFGTPVTSYEEWNTRLTALTAASSIEMETELGRSFVNMQAMKDKNCVEMLQQTAAGATDAANTNRPMVRELIDGGCQVMGDSFRGLMNTVQGGAAIGLAVNAHITATPTETMLLLAPLLLLAYLLFIISDNIASLSRDISGGFSNAALGRSFEAPGERIARDTLNPSTMLGMTNL